MHSAHLCTLRKIQYRIVGFAHFGASSFPHTKAFDVVCAGAATSCWRWTGRAHGGWPTRRWCAFWRSSAVESPWPSSRGRAAWCSVMQHRPALTDECWRRSFRLSWAPQACCVAEASCSAVAVRIASHFWWTADTSPGDFFFFLIVVAVLFLFFGGNKDERQTVRSPRRRPGALRREDVGLEPPQTVFGVNGWEDNVISLLRHQVDAVCVRV